MKGRRRYDSGVVSESLAAIVLAPRPLVWAPLMFRHVSPKLERGGEAGTNLVKPARTHHFVACITVSRTAATDVGFREVFVSVDDREVAMLGHGETVTHELAAGPHRIQAHNTLFWKTHNVVLQPGEHARFTAINRAGWGTFGLLLLLGVGPIYLTFAREGAG